jgi:integrase
VDAANEFLVAKARAQVSRPYLRQLRWTLNHFLKDGPQGPAVSITPRQVEDFVCRESWQPATRRNVLTDLRTFFGWLVKRGYLATSPAGAVDKPRLVDRPPGIHTPDQVAQVLETARSVDLEVCRLLAIQYFAGLRPAEACRLVESDLLADYVVVTAAKAKTRQRRLVKVQPALRAWLDVGGQLPVKNWVKRWRAVRQAAGVPWPPDVTRHSFASYHLARWRSQDATAHELGHRSTAMLFAHYRELVTLEQSRQFWAIRPKTSARAAP